MSDNARPLPLLTEVNRAFWTSGAEGCCACSAALTVSGLFIRLRCAARTTTVCRSTWISAGGGK